MHNMSHAMGRRSRQHTQENKNRLEKVTEGRCILPKAVALQKFAEGRLLSFASKAFADMKAANESHSLAMV
jgi:hypothetical protein